MHSVPLVAILGWWPQMAAMPEPFGWWQEGGRLWWKRAGMDGGVSGWGKKWASCGRGLNPGCTAGHQIWTPFSPFLVPLLSLANRIGQAKFPYFEENSFGVVLLREYLIRTISFTHLKHHCCYCWLFQKAGFGLQIWGAKKHVPAGEASLESRTRSWRKWAFVARNSQNLWTAIYISAKAWLLWQQQRYATQVGFLHSPHFWTIKYQAQRSWDFLLERVVIEKKALPSLWLGFRSQHLASSLSQIWARGTLLPLESYNYKWGGMQDQPEVQWISSSNVSAIQLQGKGTNLPWGGLHNCPHNCPIGTSVSVMESW